MNTISFPKNLYEYIDITKERTALYVGEKSITSMYCHILGYQMACFYKSIEENLAPDFRNFDEFVKDYYNHETTTAGWKNIILSKCQNDELESLKQFYNLLDLFRRK